MSQQDWNEPSKRIVVPLVVRGSKLTPFYGGEMPPLKEGSLVDLLVEKHAFSRPADVARFDLEKRVTILEAGQKLWAALKVEPLFHPLAGMPPAPPSQTGLPAGNALVPFTLEAPLILRLRGTKLAELEDCACRLDTRDNAHVPSVNVAYTRLSEHYEPSRRSHTGNVFLKVYFQDGTLARPLDALRQRIAAEFEKDLFHRSGELPLDGRGGAGPT